MMMMMMMMMVVMMMMLMGIITYLDVSGVILSSSGIFRSQNLFAFAFPTTCISCKIL